jgi:acyl carrier protein
MDGKELWSHNVTLAPAEVDARIEEYREVRPVPGEDALALLETALFLEEALDIRLTDDEIVPENLATIEAIRRFLAKRQERG